MALKTDYVDALYEKKRVRLEDNGDGTYTPVHETNYTRQGDKFGAKDINATNAALNKAVRQRNITLPASGWSSQYPFTQTVSVEGLVQEDDLKVIGVLIPDGTSQDQVKAINKAAGYLMSSEDSIGDGSATFHAYKKPAVDITVITEGG